MSYLLFYIWFSVYALIMFYTVRVAMAKPASDGLLAKVAFVLCVAALALAWPAFLVYFLLKRLTR